MANPAFIYKLPRHAAKQFYDLKYTTSKLQRTASSLAFVKKAIVNKVTPTFAKVTGNISNENYRKKAEMNNLKTELNTHNRNLRELIDKQHKIRENIRNTYGNRFHNFVHYLVLKTLRENNIKQLQTKNQKLFNLTGKHNNTQYVKLSIPIINLSSQDLDTTILEKTGLNHSYIDKNKFMKRELIVELETLANTVDNTVKPENKEEFHEFLRSTTNIFTQNVFHTKDKTFKSLSELRQNKNIVILSGDKDSSIVIMDRKDYVNKVNKMIDEGIHNGKYALSDEDKTHNNLHNFQQFLYRNFRKHSEYTNMRPNSNQPGRFFATAKTHKFNSFEEMTVENVKLRPIIDQTGTHTHAAAKIISKYLQPLAKNDFIIEDSLKFPGILKETPTTNELEDVSYDAESLFTSIPVNETIDFIIDEIYTRKIIKPFCDKKLIFRRLLERLCFENQFSYNGTLATQIEGCTMGGSLSGTLSNIFMKKLEQDIVVPTSPIFYKRYVDDVYNRRNKDEIDTLFHNLNSYHPNMKFTVEKNPNSFLDTTITRENDNTVTTAVYTKPNKVPIFWTSRVPKRYKRNALKTDLHRAKQISSDFENEIKRIKKKYRDAGYPPRFIEAVIKEFLEPQDLEEIPNWLFEDRQSIMIRLPFCETNESESWKFTNRLEQYTQNKYKFIIIWNTKKIRSLFPLKDKNLHRSTVIYEGICSCGDTYIGETNRNAQIRWSEHDKPSENSEPSKHRLAHKEHKFEWKIISSAPHHHGKRKILENLHIAKLKPKLNEQLQSDILKLFKHGYT